jgi:hypothetical protein
MWSTPWLHASLWSADWLYTYVASWLDTPMWLAIRLHTYLWLAILLHTSLWSATWLSTSLYDWLLRSINQLCTSLWLAISLYTSSWLFLATYGVQLPWYFCDRMLSYTPHSDWLFRSTSLWDWLLDVIPLWTVTVLAVLFLTSVWLVVLIQNPVIGSLSSFVVIDRLAMRLP